LIIRINLTCINQCNTGYEPAIFMKYNFQANVKRLSKIINIQADYIHARLLTNRQTIFTLYYLQTLQTMRFVYCLLADKSQLSIRYHQPASNPLHNKLRTFFILSHLLPNRVFCLFHAPIHIPCIISSNARLILEIITVSEMPLSWCEFC